MKLGTNIETVKVTDLAPHPENPRRGNIDVIKESLATTGQFRPVLANSRNNTIIGGHHVVQAATELGWEKVAVLWLDVDDTEHKRIMLADNRAADLGDYDQEILLALLQDADDLAGTGYTDDDLQAIIAASSMPDQSDWGGALSALPEGEPSVRTRTFSLTNEQAEIVDRAVAKGLEQSSGDGNRNGAALAWACSHV